MFKNLLAFSCVICLTVFSMPINLLNNQTSVCKNGKSSGIFITENVRISDLFNCDGVSVRLNADYNYKRIIEKLNAKAVHKFFDGELLNLYYYTEKLPKKEIINGKAVNLHFAINADQITVGTPIIYGGY